MKIITIGQVKKTGPIYTTAIDDEDEDWINHYTLYPVLTTRMTIPYVATTCSIYGGAVGLHRLILGLKKGDGLLADHIDNNPLNNQRSNLRITTHAGNAQNVKMLKTNKSGYRNVCWYGRFNKWQVKTQLNGKAYSLGYFDTPEEANEVAIAWRKIHMPYSEEPHQTI